MPIAGEGAWRIWARVLSDDGARLADGALNEAWSEIGNATVDFPVLENCDSDISCERGYWLIFQSFATSSRAFTARAQQAVRTLGQFSWGLEAAAVSDSEVGPARLALAVDTKPGDVHPSSLEIESIPMTLVEPLTPHSLSVTFTIDRPRIPDGTFDPLAATVAIVHTEIRGDHVYTHIEGDGAGSLLGFLSGDAPGNNLIAHPFDSCITDGPCEATIRLVAEYGDPRASVRYERSAEVVWGISLIGAPPQTNFAISDVVVSPRPVLTRPPVVISVVIAGLVIAAAAVILVLRRRRAKNA